MRKLLKQKVLQINTATGVEVTFLADGQLLMNSLTLRVHKGVLQKEAVTHSVKKISELKINKTIPVSIVCSGKGILIKKIEGNKITDNPLQQVLPQANPNDFYVQSSNHNGFAAIALARKDLIDNLISEFEKEGFKILNFSLGFSIIDTILPFIKLDETDAIHSVNYLLKQNKQQLIDFELQAEPQNCTQSEYFISGQYIQAAQILPYGAAATLIADYIENSPEINQEKVAANREHFVYQQYFKTAGFSFLIALFCLLLVNFIIYNYYFKENKKFQATQTISQQSLSMNKSLYAEVKKKEQFIKRSGWLKPSKTSFYADRFASLLPEDIWLTNLQFYPMHTSLLPNESSVSFKSDTILVSGSCTDAAQINTFISNLKTIEEIKNVFMKGYSYKKEENTGIFSLEIITQ